MKDEIENIISVKKKNLICFVVVRTPNPMLSSGSGESSASNKSGNVVSGRPKSRVCPFFLNTNVRFCTVRFKKCTALYGGGGGINLLLMGEKMKD